MFSLNFSESCCHELRNDPLVIFCCMIGLKVIATAGSPEGLLFVKKQGADEVFDHK